MYFGYQLLNGKIMNNFFFVGWIFIFFCRNYLHNSAQFKSGYYSNYWKKKSAPQKKRGGGGFITPTTLLIQPIVNYVFTLQLDHVLKMWQSLGMWRIGSANQTLWKFLIDYYYYYYYYYYYFIILLLLTFIFKVET
jgi:hypothetical protein